MKQPLPVTRREIFGWCSFDFANSSFTTIITTVVYARYFEGVVAKGNEHSVFLWSLAAAIANALTVLIGPWLGALADQTGRKKTFLTASAFGCSIATAALFFTGEGTIALALALVIFATLCFSLGENLTASFLPELSTPETAGKISGYGWAFGYFGGLASLALCLPLVDIDVRLTSPAVGAFFILATVPTMLWLRERAPRRAIPPLGKLFSETLGTTARAIRGLREQPALGKFFVAFFVYMMGVVCVVQFAGIYAGKEFGYDTPGVIRLFIFLQLSAAAGAFAFGFLQDKIGSMAVLALSLLGWVGVSVSAALVQTQEQFFFVALGAGAVIGSTQSASRALVSQLCRTGREGETFGLWGFFGKIAAIFGPPIFGYFASAFSLRAAIAATALFFAAGLFLLLFWQRQKRA